MAAERLAPYARLPRPYRQQTVLHSTVDAFGRAHWLLRAPTAPRDLYDAVVVTVEDGRPYETHLGSVQARFPKLDALPDGGFVVADSRTRAGTDQVQVFDALGRPSWGFTVGDGIEHLLGDESGNLWVGYFDEGVFGDPLSAPCVRCWSQTGAPVWEYRPQPGERHPVDCYALNVDRRAAWAYPYTEFPLIEAREGRPARVRGTPVRGAKGLAVHGDRVLFFGGYRNGRDRVHDCRLTETSVESVAERRLARPDGGTLGSCRVVCRGPRLYVQEKPCTEWNVLDIAG
ncbi:hypothetical protein [Streptomyces dysideae]|uniref:Uncharacterized protein n=1 Tax=Streptomyces dysideae TaxID=909626 RepID=A0A101UYU5_9ACTN|nr:hypothetical protein [Streptomyces dysideae]KUO19388.1 hypothetical protein AQJ91_20790 [Streptomyces dysideae]